VLESQQYVDRCTWKEMAFGPLPKQAQGQKTASAILWQHTCCHVDVLAKDRMAIKFTMPQCQSDMLTSERPQCSIPIFGEHWQPQPIKARKAINIFRTVRDVCKHSQSTRWLDSKIEAEENLGWHEGTLIEIDDPVLGNLLCLYTYSTLHPLLCPVADCLGPIIRMWLNVASLG